MVITKTKAKPFLKWVGGKTQLLDKILPLIPKDVTRYHEPFLGGGAVFFALAQRQPIQAVLSDANRQLINTYQVVQNNYKKLDIILGLLAAQHSEESYYRVRELDRSIMYGGIEPAYQAARFIYLNKAGFNGLYRVNKNGENNVPWNHKDTVSLPTEQHLAECSALLKGSVICHEFFGRETFRLGDFFYFDPPYIPLNADSFTDYHEDGFGLDDHQRLKQYCDRIHERGARFLLSNSDTPLTRELWGDYTIEVVEARRNVNSKGDGRGVVKELLIRNY